MYRDNKEQGDYRNNREIIRKLTERELPTELRVDDKYPENMVPSDKDYEKVQGGRPDIFKVQEGTYKLVHRYLQEADLKLKDEEITVFTVIKFVKKHSNLYVPMPVGKDGKGKDVYKMFPSQLLLQYHGAPCQEKSRLARR